MSHLDRNGRTSRLSMSGVIGQHAANVPLPMTSVGASRKRPRSHSHNYNNNSNSTTTTTTSKMVSQFGLVGLTAAFLCLGAILSFHPANYNINYSSVALIVEEHRPTQSQKEFEERFTKRRRRTRPPPSQERAFNGTLPKLYSDNPKQVRVEKQQDWKSMHEYHDNLCGTNTPNAAAAFPNSFPQSLALSPKSRVIITSILSPLGMNLALEMAEHCGVEQILGIDAVLPNTPQFRFEQMERHALLKRKIPTLKKLQVPQKGIDVNSGLNLTAFQPTHIVHLPMYSETDNVLYEIRDSAISMEQILSIMMHTNQPPHLTYVGQDMTLETVLAKSYNSFFGLSSVGIEVPKLYGPWGQQDSWVWTLAEGIVRPNSTRNQLRETVFGDDQFIYVQDAVQAMLTAMQLKRGAITFRLSSTTNPSALEKAVIAILKGKPPASENQTEITVKELGWMPKMSAFEGMSKTLSWHYSRAFPYGGGPPRPVEGSYHFRFPCASECSLSHDCLLSPFDAVIKLTQKKTSGCKIVLYMINLWSDTTALPASAPIGKSESENATSTTFCRIAFVSRNSPVGNMTDSSGWDIIPVYGDAAGMSEAEYMLPKLSPSKLFHRTVSRAMFVDPEHFKIPAADDILGMLRMIDASPKKGKLKRISRSGTPIFKLERQPDSPGRAVTLFTQEQTFSEVSLNGRIKELLARDGVQPKPRLQLQQQHYEHASHLVINGERRSLTTMAENEFPKFPWLWIRSTLLVHDLRHEESRLLRCEWYDEQVFWGNSDLEDLSFAWIMARRRVRRERGDGDEWIPLTDRNTGEAAKDRNGQEMYMRVMLKPKRKEE